MHSSLTAVVLCILTHTAAAECAMTASLAGNEQQGHPFMTPAAVAAAPAQRGGGALIKTAAAGTRDEPAAPRATQAPAQAASSQDDHPPRSGTAMLLTAIALMSGIALRRYGSNTQ